MTVASRRRDVLRDDCPARADHCRPARSPCFRGSAPSSRVRPGAPHRRERGSTRSPSSSAGPLPCPCSSRWYSSRSTRAIRVGRAPRRRPGSPPRDRPWRLPACPRRTALGPRNDATAHRAPRRRSSVNSTVSIHEGRAFSGCSYSRGRSRSRQPLSLRAIDPAWGASRRGSPSSPCARLARYSDSSRTSFAAASVRTSDSRVWASGSSRAGPLLFTIACALGGGYLLVDRRARPNRSIGTIQPCSAPVQRLATVAAHGVSASRGTRTRLPNPDSDATPTTDDVVVPYEEAVCRVRFPLLSMFWVLCWWFFLFSVFFGVIWAFIDNFRRHDHSGWAKAGWAFLIIILPFFGMLIYSRAPRMRGSPHRSCVVSARFRLATRAFERLARRFAEQGSVLAGKATEVPEPVIGCGTTRRASRGLGTLSSA